MGFEEYLARFISSLLYTYSEEELDKNNVESLSVSISKNSISMKLKDLIMYRNSFLQHGLPFFVRLGSVSNISMNLSLKESNQIDINDIFFYLRFVDSQKFPSIEEFNEMRDHQLYAHELFKDKISLISNKYLWSNFNEQMKNALSDSSISMSNMYFCVELNDAIIGIFINNINLVGNQIQGKNNKNNSNNANTELRMKMVMNGLKVFMIQKFPHDQEREFFIDESDNFSFIQNMRQFFNRMIQPGDDESSANSPNDYILDIDEIDGQIIYETGKNLLVLINNEEKIEDKIRISLWQIVSLAKVIPELLKYHKYFLTKHIQRPSFLQSRRKSDQSGESSKNKDENDSENEDNRNENENNRNENENNRNENEVEFEEEEEDNDDDNGDDFADAWLFVHRCAIEINSDKSSSASSSNSILGQFIPSFAKRNQYLKVWQNFKSKPFNPTLLYELDHSLTYHQITLFRYMSEMLRKKWSRKPLTREDVYKALEFVEMDLASLIMFFINKANIHLNFSKIITNFYLYQTRNNESKDKIDLNYYLSLSVMNPTLSFYIDKFESFNIDLRFSSFKLRDSKNNNIIDTIENGSKGYSFNTSFYGRAFRVHNNYINNTIKGSNENTILDDLTSIKISGKITDQIFFISRNDIFSFLKNIDLNRIFSILSSSTEFNNAEMDEFKTSLNLSTLFNIDQTLPLYSLFEKVDIDFIMDNCQLSLLLNEPYQLTFVYEKMLIQRQLEQLEFENKQHSVNAKKKLTDTVRKLFQKSDLLFDITNLNILLGNSKIEKILTNEISIHTIFMVSKKKILTFISPLFFQTNWTEIKQLKSILSDLLNNWNQFQLTSTFNSIKELSLELPKFIQDIEVTGGIPSISISLDLPSSQHKLLTMNIDTVKFDGKIANFDIKASVNKITFEDLLEVNNIDIDLKKKHFVFEKVNFAMLKMLALMPRDLMEIIELNPLTIDFSFLMKTLSVDLSIDWINEPIDYTVTNFGGNCDSKKGGTIFLKCFVNCINLCHKPIIKNQEVSGTIDLLDTINIFVDFGDLELIFLHEIFGLAFNNVWKCKEVFPTDFALDWSIKVDSLLMEDMVYCENANIYMQMSDVAFGGDLTLESIEIVDMKIEKKYPISLSFDLTRHYFSTAVNFDYVEVDVLRIISMAQYFLHFPFHITQPLTLDVKIMPMTVGLYFDPTGKSSIHPSLSIYDNIDVNSILSQSNNSNIDTEDESENENGATKNDKDNMIFINMRSALYFDGSKVSISMETNDFEIYLGDEKFLSIPYFELYGDKQWQMNAPVIDLQFSSFSMISKLLKILSTIPRLSIEIWGIRHSLINILTTFKIGLLRCMLNNSIQFNITQILASFLNYELNLKCNMSLRLYSTWFVHSELMKIDDVKLQCILNNNDKMIASKALINSPIQMKVDYKSFNSIRDFLTESKTDSNFLTIINKTDHSFTCKLGKIPEQSTFVYPVFFDDNDFELSFTYGTIPIRRENFENNGEMKVIPDNFDDGIVLYLNEANQLKISYVFSVINKTESSFKIEYKNKKYQLKAKSLLSNLPAITGNFKINGKNINLDRTGTASYNNIYLIKSTKRSIVIQPEYFIINECPFDIQINQVTYKMYSKSEFILNIIDNPNATIQSVVFPPQKIDFNELKDRKFFSYKLKSVYDFDFPFVLRIQVLNKSKSFTTLVFSPSVIIKSKFSNLLVSPDKLNCFPLTKNNDFAFSPHKKFISRVFLTTSEDFSFTEIILNEKAKKKGRDELIILDSIKEEGVIYPFTITRFIKKYPYYNIEIIEVCPYVTIMNNTAYNLMIYTPNSKTILVEKDKVLDLEDVESSFNFSFSIEELNGLKKAKSSQPKQLLNNFSIITNNNNNNNNSIVHPFFFNFNKICSQKVVSAGFFMPIDIYVHQDHKNVAKTITFSVANDFPCRIINLSSYTLCVENKEFKPKAAHLFAPSHQAHPLNDEKSTSQIPKSIVGSNKINLISNPFCISKIGVQSIEFEEVTPTNESSNEDIENLSGFMKVLYYNEEHRMSFGSIIREIVVSDSLEEIQRFKFGLLNQINANKLSGNFENDTPVITFSFEAILNEFHLSLFDKEPNHNVNIHLKGFRMLANQNSADTDASIAEYNGAEDIEVKMNHLFISIGTLEIRDFRKQLILGTKEKNEFVKFIAKNAFSPYHIQEVGFSIKPFYFKFDMSLFSYLISAFFDLHSNEKIRFNNDEVPQIMLDNQARFMTLFDDGLIEKLKIDPISIMFSFEVGQNISPEFPQILRIIPSAKPFSFNITQNEFREIRFQNKSLSDIKTSELVPSMKRGQIKFLVKNASKFVFSLNIFGSPYALFEHLFFKQFGVFSIFSFVFGFLENVSDYARSLCHFLAGQDHLKLKDPKSPVVWGFTSMFMCVFNGIAFFFNSTFKEKNPIKGLWKMIFSDAGGLLDALSGIFMFIRSLFSDDFDVEKELQSDE